MDKDKMIEINHVTENDREFWYTLDRHLPPKEFSNKVRDKMGYVLFCDNKPVGILRYCLLWDNTPFCTLLFVNWSEQRKGYGSLLMKHWENEMKELGYGLSLVSTQVDEDAQHFYRKIGYKDCGGIILDIEGYEQPMEMFLVKKL